TATIVALRSEGNPGDPLTFRVYLNNTGSSSAVRAWLNDTQLPGFAYLSDTAAAAGSSTPWPSFTFAGVANGPRTFDITARIAIGTEPGTMVIKGTTLTYLNATSVPKTAPGSQASVLVGKQTKQVYLSPIAVGSAERLSPPRSTGDATDQYNETLSKDASAHDFDLSPVLSRPFRTYGANATLYIDSATHDVRNLDINLTLSDWNGVTLIPLASFQQRVRTNNFADYQAFSFSFPGVNHTFPSGGRIRLTLRNMGSSATDAIVAMNCTFAASRGGHLLDAHHGVRIERRDGCRGRDRPGPPASLYVRTGRHGRERGRRRPIHVQRLVQQHGSRHRGAALDQRQPAGPGELSVVVRSDRDDGSLQLDVDVPRPGERPAQ